MKRFFRETLPICIAAALALAYIGFIYILAMEKNMLLALKAGGTVFIIGFLELLGIAILIHILKGRRWEW